MWKSDSKVSANYYFIIFSFMVKFIVIRNEYIFNRLNIV